VNREFNIWLSTNAKSATPTWTLVEGNLTLPSIRSCAIVNRKDGTGKNFTEYYVGTSVGLYSTLGIKDTLAAGKPITWSREGGTLLNFAVVNSLSYRPQDNLLLVGTHGNGMFFTTIPEANYTPNTNTAVNEPVRNNKDFIRFSWPGITSSAIQFKTGNMFEVKKLVVQLYNSNGQLLYKKETGYTDGSIDVSRFAKGVYILTVTSADNKQQFVKKFIRQ
jgi:Secretion system C-terminal sorting domain